jgi:hypothetical protein
MMAPPVSYLESTVPAATCEMAVSVESVAALVLLWSRLLRWLQLATNARRIPIPSDFFCFSREQLDSHFDYVNRKHFRTFFLSL